MEFTKVFNLSDEGLDFTEIREFFAYFCCTFYLYLHLRICASNHMFGRAIWDKLPECIFEHFDIARVKRGQFQNFQKSQG